MPFYLYNPEKPLVLPEGTRYRSLSNHPRLMGNELLQIESDQEISLTEANRDQISILGTAKEIDDCPLEWAIFTTQTQGE